MTDRVAIVGGGWAGMAAAVTLACAARPVTVFEAAQVLGGRARRVVVDGRTLDNGQHLLLGAYAQTLALLRTVHGDRAERELFDRRRLHLEEPGVFRFKTPALPAPWHLGVALLAMRGLPRQDRLATVDLPALFPAAAAAYVAARAGEVRTSVTVPRLDTFHDGVAVTSEAGEERFAAAIIAVGPHQLAHVLAPSASSCTTAALAQVA